MIQALHRSRSRRGMSLIVVLCVLAVTLGTSYALMRSQYTSLRIQQNMNRGNLARQAAMVGVSDALRRIEATEWITAGGVTSTLSGNLSASESYAVSFAVGDSTLTSGNPAYAEYPYRMTITSTGTSVDPAHPQSQAKHRMKAVVRLIPRKLTSGPAELPFLPLFTLFQTQDDVITIQPPMRIQGAVRIQGKMDWGTGTFKYTWSNAIRDRYLSHLHQMRLAGQPDYRPFEGALCLSFSKYDSGERDWLTNTVGAALTNVPNTSESDSWEHPATVSTYRLYPGGPSYNVGTAAASLTNTTLQADPLTNPAGIFFRSGAVTLNANATIRGTLICRGTLSINGAGVNIQPATFPAIYGGSTATRMPTVLAEDDIDIGASSQPTVEGLLVAFDRFTVYKRSLPPLATFRANIAAEEFELGQGFNEYTTATTASTWNTRNTTFQNQLSLTPHIDWFPQWLLAFTPCKIDPPVKFLPPTTQATYGWITNGGTIFEAHASDAGLRWELVSLRDE